MGTVFGGRGAGSFLAKVTIVLAIIFVLSNLSQGFLIRGRGERKSLVQQELQKEGSVSAADMLPKVEIPAGGQEGLTGLPVAPPRQATSADSAK